MTFDLLNQPVYINHQTKTAHENESDSCFREKRQCFVTLRCFLLSATLLILCYGSTANIKFLIK